MADDVENARREVETARQLANQKRAEAEAATRRINEQRSTTPNINSASALRRDYSGMQGRLQRRQIENYRTELDKSLQEVEDYKQDLSRYEGEVSQAEGQLKSYDSQTAAFFAEKEAVRQANKALARQRLGLNPFQGGLSGRALELFREANADRIQEPTAPSYTIGFDAQGRGYSIDKDMPKAKRMEIYTVSPYKDRSSAYLEVRPISKLPLSPAPQPTFKEVFNDATQDYVNPNPKPRFYGQPGENAVFNKGSVGYQASLGSVKTLGRAIDYALPEKSREFLYSSVDRNIKRVSPWGYNALIVGSGIVADTIGASTLGPFLATSKTGNFKNALKINPVSKTNIPKIRLSTEEQSIKSIQQKMARQEAINKLRVNYNQFKQQKLLSLKDYIISQKNLAKPRVTKIGDVPFVSLKPEPRLSLNQLNLAEKRVDFLLAKTKRNLQPLSARLTGRDLPKQYNQKDLINSLAKKVNNRPINPSVKRPLEIRYLGREKPISLKEFKQQFFTHLKEDKIKGARSLFAERLIKAKKAYAERVGTKIKVTSLSGRPFIGLGTTGFTQAEKRLSAAIMQKPKLKIMVKSSFLDLVAPSSSGRMQLLQKVRPMYTKSEVIQISKPASVQSNVFSGLMMSNKAVARSGVRRPSSRVVPFWGNSEITKSVKKQNQGQIDISRLRNTDKLTSRDLTGTIGITKLSFGNPSLYQYRHKFNFDYQFRSSSTPSFRPRTSYMSKGGKVVQVGINRYVVFVRRYGQNNIIGEAGTLSDAKDILRNNLRSTLAASGYVTEKSTGRKQKVNDMFGGMFGPSKRDPYRLVQNRGKRLSSRSEVNEIWGYRGRVARQSRVRQPKASSWWGSARRQPLRKKKKDLWWD